MIPVEKLLRVNANPVGDHPPESLMAVSSRIVRKVPEKYPTWNHFVWAEDGRAYRVTDRYGQPIYPAAEFTPNDLADVAIEDAPADIDRTRTATITRDADGVTDISFTVQG